MENLVLNIEFKPGKSYQQQIREKLVELISLDQFGAKALPSSRKMAQQLGVSRNTVVLVYESLVDEGYLIAHQRSGFFVNPELKKDAKIRLVQLNTSANENAPRWDERLVAQPSSFGSLNKDKAWMSYEYPFIYGQIDTNDFPIYQWRDCSRTAHNRNALHEWVEDYMDDDDPELVTQIRQQVASKRGIRARPNEILITLGTQNSLFLLASLLSSKQTTVGIEEPGCMDFHQIFQWAGAKTKPVRVDTEGLTVGETLQDCDYVCVTPSHHYPTTVTMPMARRKALLKQACVDDFVIIEDDYESEVNFSDEPLPALKSMDTQGRVVYVASLSKSLSPGLRIGYLIAHPALIKELRALRRLNYRHPPANNQRVAAQFISQGYYDSHVRRMRRVFANKWKLMHEYLNRYLTTCTIHGTPGGFCFWIELPDNIPSETLVARAAQYSILVESGDRLFARQYSPKNFIRIGFTAISEDKIASGLKKLGQLITQISSETQYSKKMG